MVLKPLAFSLSALVLVAVAVVTLFIIHPLIALLGVVLFPLLLALSLIYTSRVEAPSAGPSRRSARSPRSPASKAPWSSRRSGASRRGRAAAPTSAPSGRNAWCWSDPSGVRAGHRCPAQHRCGFVAAHRRLVINGDAPGDLLAAVVFGLLATPLRVFGFFLEEMPRSVVALDRVDEVWPSRSSNAAGTATVPADGRCGRARSGRRLWRAPSPQGVDLEVAAGRTAVVGATGSGKSTCSRRSPASSTASRHGCDWWSRHR